mgnify:CR=1 FL=1
MNNAHILDNPFDVFTPIFMYNRRPAATIHDNVDSRDCSRIIDLCVATALAPAALLAMGIMYGLYRLTIRDGGPFLYRGTRLGLNKIPFTIYKIRSLRMNAEQTLGAAIYNGGKPIELWYGTFIRKTRIDELPQLYNIFRGEMSLIGPRPVRPIMYHTQLRHIKGFDRRFSVRPGITGHSQFFTPAASSMRIRSLIDNRFARSDITWGNRLLFFLYTAATCLWVMCSESIAYAVRTIIALVSGKPVRCRRKRQRRRPDNIVAAHLCSQNSRDIAVSVVDMTHETMLMNCPMNLDVSDNTREFDLRLRFYYHRSKRRRVSEVQLRARIVGSRERTPDGLFRYVAEFSTGTEYGRYMVDKYILKDSVA